MDATKKAWNLGINPGGEVLFQRVEEPELELNRLYTRDEMLQMGYAF